MSKSRVVILIVVVLCATVVHADIELREEHSFSARPGQTVVIDVSLHTVEAPLPEKARSVYRDMAGLMKAEGVTAKTVAEKIGKLRQIAAGFLYDGDDADKQDFGIRSPDNLVWADDGQVYIQEDRSVSGFGAVSGEETSIWKLDPKSGLVDRVGQVYRAGVPTNQVDTDPTDLGDWETSGVIDVTELFGAEGERLLFLNVQAHSIRSLSGGRVVSGDLEQGGQFLFMSKPE